ncbi:MAG TPA: hypothetical protein DCP20_01665 [Coriobacteriia bacterium]|nr:MAG: hypothetical protein XD74_0288 [Actinobacteria bacterium 66_15]HAL29411.1 hypothetical protein [Coriobacteriia bacterium]
MTGRPGEGIDVSLARALANLELDAAAARVLRDVLVLFTHHPDEPLTERDIVMRTGHERETLHEMLTVLVRAFVLDFDSASGTYTFNGDVVVGFEIETFRRSVDSHQGHVSSNVARFRERHGS